MRLYVDVDLFECCLVSVTLFLFVSVRDYSCFDFKKLKSESSLVEIEVIMNIFSIGASEDQVREAIQREIEKEQIRQEIIIAEAARKRELIAEVLQEMAIEREMAKRRVLETGMSLEEKLSMWINQRKLPNQDQNQNQNNLFSQNCTYTDPMMYTGSYNSIVKSPMMQLAQLHKMHEATGTSVMESNKEKLVVLVSALFK